MKSIQKWSMAEKASEGEHVNTEVVNIRMIYEVDLHTQIMADNKG